MKFQFYSDDLIDSDILSVDGIAPKGLNLSHWPGNRTPQQFKADTSTEICFNFIESQEYNSIKDNTEIITNNHYDTDGFLSVAVVLYPELSLKHKKHLIDTAITGDFRRFTTNSALQLDLAVSNLSSNPNSPLINQVKGLQEIEKRQLQYEYLLEHYPKLLDNIGTFEELWVNEYNMILSELNGKQFIQLDYDADLDLSIIFLEKPIHEISLKTICKGTRILSIHLQGNAYFYDFQYTVESWFELVSKTILKRKKLTELFNNISSLDPEALWQLEDLQKPVVHLKCSKKSTLQPELFINLLRNSLQHNE